MGTTKLGAILLTAFAFFHSTASAVEFEECTKFINVDKHKYSQCTEYSFAEATQKGDYQKANQWLIANRNTVKNSYDSMLTSLMCVNETTKGGIPFDINDRQNVIRLTDQLINLGASFESMPIGTLVTPLFCVANRQDSVILNHVLTRIKATKKHLDASLYEGTYQEYVPLYRAVMNNDIASAKVLVKHGATVDFSVSFNETALKKSLELGHIEIANWLLDIGASVHKRDDNKGCSGKSPLDYALEIPAHVAGRGQLIERIQQLELSPSSFQAGCS